MTRLNNALDFKWFLTVLLAVALQLGGARLVLSENFHEGARGEPESGRRGLCVAVLGRHNVEYVRDEQRKKGVARLKVPVAPREWHFGVGWGFADLQGERHLHPVQCMHLVFVRGPSFAGFDF